MLQLVYNYLGNSYCQINKYSVSDSLFLHLFIFIAYLLVITSYFLWIFFSRFKYIKYAWIVEIMQLCLAKRYISKNLLFSLINLFFNNAEFYLLCAWDRPQKTMVSILGCLVSLGGLKTKFFNLLRLECLKKLNGWKETVLSQVDKEIIIKNVVQAIPIYVMSCFFFLVNIILFFNSMVLQFFWGGSESNNKLHWKSGRSM